MTDEEFVNAELWKVANAARREVAEEIAVAVEEFLGSPSGPIAADIARRIGAQGVQS